MDPVVSTEWLGAHLGEPNLRVLDARFYLPTLRRDGRAEHAESHLPGAVYFDVDEVADRTSSLPHMLPAPEAFARAVSALGVGDGDRIVAYGARNMGASARVWWMFRVFGHDRVAILDGGIGKWKAEGRPLEGGVSPAPQSRGFSARFRPELVSGLDQMRTNVESRRLQVIDARSAGRFVGTEPEPRPGLRGGHIPGSVNLPYDRLFAPEDNSLLPVPALRQAFEAAGLDLARPVVASCGSGVSACVLALGLYLLGRPDVAVYDGSWTEWGGREDTPVER